MLESSKHHDGQLLVRRRSDASRIQVSKTNRTGRRDEANTGRQSTLATNKKDNGLPETKKVG